MCTVTYIPSKEGFIFTSSRDERYDRRKTEFPITQNKLVFPRDYEAKGTWIASNKQQLCCLLNGAFNKHERKDHYKKSRGLMLLDSFLFDSITDFLNQYDFNNMEPFTLVCVDSNHVHEIRWDEVRIYHTKKSLLDRHIWSSCTLYTSEIMTQREVAFSEWHQKSSIGIDTNYARDFHYTSGKDDPLNAVFLKRETKGTISITSIEQTKDTRSIIYDDLENGVQTFEIK